MKAYDRIVLASASRSRAMLLRNAGLEVTIVPSGVDEAAVKSVLLSENSLSDLADLPLMLAETKALAVSESENDALIIAADQVLVFDNRPWNKPASFDEARQQLLALRGRTHSLETAATVWGNGEQLWSHQASAQLTMRNFSPEFLGHYLAAVGEAALESVGGYQIEGRGIQLFDRIEGDYFSILGLPLLPLLDKLRELSMIET